MYFSFMEVFMFKSTGIFLLVIASLICLSAAAVEGVLIGMPDPAVIQAAEDSFYIFATGRGLPVYHSSDLVHWEKAGTVFDRPAPAWAKTMIPETRGIWAPDIVKLNDNYFVYYSVCLLQCLHLRQPALSHRRGDEQNAGPHVT
jgi:arabinan endo-1,5-alpha-L-arabinosidase